MTDKKMLASIHQVSDTVKVDPKEEHANTTDRMTVIHYKRLVVPANMRSIYWKCYGFPANEENEILTKTKIVCLLCKTQICYNRNTSNLRMHLQNKHKQELETLELVQPQPLSKLGNADKRSAKRKKSMLKTEQAVTQVFPAPEEQGGSIKRYRPIKQPTRYGEWLEKWDDDEVEVSTPVAGSEVISPNSQYIAEMDDMNPLRVIVKEATSNQTYALVDGKIIAEAIADFLILDLQSPDVVEGKGFQRLLATLKSPCEIPSKARLMDDILPKMYETVRDHLQPQISVIKSDVSLSIEDWVAANGNTYSTVSLHYIIDGESDLQSKILSTIYCSETDDNAWGSQFDAIMEEWNIKSEKVRAVIVASDRSEVMENLSARSLTIVPCLSYTLQQACVKGVFNDPDVTEVLQKCRGLIALINRHPAAQTSLRLQENLLNIEDPSFTADNSNWLSTLNMMEQINVRKPILPSVLENLGSSISGSTNIELTDAQWQLLDDVITVLSPFKVTMVTLVEEKSPHISILKPILWQLLNVHLQKTDADSENVIKFKTAICQDLTEKYSHPSVNELLDLTTILDPRFKCLTFMNEKDKPALQKKLKELLLEQISRSTDVVKTDEMIKKRRLSGMEFLLGDLCSPKPGMPAHQRVDVELVQYECELPAALEKSPVDAWKDLQGKCGQMAVLAITYLCCPACVVDHLNRCFQINPIIPSLPPSLAHKLKFLHRNYNPIGGTQEH